MRPFTTRPLVTLSLLILDLVHLMPSLLLGGSSSITLVVILTPHIIPSLGLPGWLPWTCLPMLAVLPPLLGIGLLLAASQLRLATNTTDRIWAAILLLSGGLLSPVYWFSLGRRTLKAQLLRAPPKRQPAPTLPPALVPAPTHPEVFADEPPLISLRRSAPCAFVPAHSGTLAPTTLHVLRAGQRRAE